MSGISSPTPSERSTTSAVSLRSMSSSVVRRTNSASSRSEKTVSLFAQMRHRVRWQKIDRWEQEPFYGEFATRGEWIDECVSRMLAICKREGFGVDDEQQLRDDVFDFVRSLSWSR